MIQEYEIRIGNAFQQDGSWSYRKEEPGEPYTFQWEASDWYALGECTLFLENVSAIPLTPEVLEKCGGIKQDNGTDFWFKKDFGVRYLDYFDPIILIIGYTRKHIPIKNLHQLQNLYFALTGEELTVQL